jgi:hypothetical protein
MKNFVDVRLSARVDLGRVDSYANQIWVYPTLIAKQVKFFNHDMIHLNKRMT